MTIKKFGANLENDDSFQRVGEGYSEQSKAIIFMNINLVLQIIGFTLAKHAITDLNINLIDWAIVKFGSLCFLSLIIAKIFGHRVFSDIQPEDRILLLTKNLEQLWL